jgi:4-aminobutyrate aminotransferase-like enzyme
MRQFSFCGTLLTKPHTAHEVVRVVRHDLGWGAQSRGPCVVAQAFQRGLLINAPRRDSLRFMPALTVTHEEIDQMIGILDEALNRWRILK